MTTRRGKRVFLGTLAVSVIVVAFAVVLTRERIAVLWYRHRLQSGDSAVAVAAAEKLGDLKAVEAIPDLLEVLVREGPSPDVGHDLASLDLIVASKVLDVVVRMAPEAGAVLAGVLEHGDPKEQFHVLQVVRHARRVDANVIELVARLTVSSERLEVREAARDAARYLELTSPDLGRALAEVFRGSNSVFRREAVGALRANRRRESLSPTDSEELARQLRDVYVSAGIPTRLLILNSIQTFDIGGGEAAALLARGLGDRSEPVRRWALRVLVRRAPTANEREAYLVALARTTTDEAEAARAFLTDGTLPPPERLPMPVGR